MGRHSPRYARIMTYTSKIPWTLPLDKKTFLKRKNTLGLRFSMTDSSRGKDLAFALAWRTLNVQTVEWEGELSVSRGEHTNCSELHVLGGRGTAHPSNLAGTGQQAVFFPLAASFKVHKMYSFPLSSPLTKSSHPKFLIFIPEAWTSTHTVITLSLENSKLENWAFLVLLRHWNFWVQHHQMLWEKQGQ